MERVTSRVSHHCIPFQAAALPVAVSRLLNTSTQRSLPLLFAPKEMFSEEEVIGPGPLNKVSVTKGRLCHLGPTSGPTSAQVAGQIRGSQIRFRC